MNELDQFMKHEIKEKYYIRFVDDFVVMNTDRRKLESMLLQIKTFLNTELRLDLHPDKVFIKTFASGVDFLGWINFSDHRVLRTTTKRRMLKALRGSPSFATVTSYKGMLRHGNTHKLQKEIEDMLN